MPPSQRGEVPTLRTPDHHLYLPPLTSRFGTISMVLGLVPVVSIIFTCKLIVASRRKQADGSHQHGRSCSLGR